MSDPIDNNSESALPDLSHPNISDDVKFSNALKYVIENDREILDRLAES